MGGNFKFQAQDSFFGIIVLGRLEDLKNESHSLKRGTFSSGYIVIFDPLAFQQMGVQKYKNNMI